jgi:hypothetical protein
MTRIVADGSSANFFTHPQNMDLKFYSRADKERKVLNANISYTIGFIDKPSSISLIFK